MITATHGNVPLNNNGHYAKNSVTHQDRTRHGLGVIEGEQLISGDWRKRNNDKPVVVKQTEVDTTGCL